MVKVIALIVALAVLMIEAPSAYAASSVGDVGGELICQCGCHKVVNSCDCSVANQFRQDIAGMLSKGQSKGEILNHYVGLYGEAVLATPPKKGFNLMVWVTPFAALVGGGLALVFLLRKWRSGGETSPEYVPLEPEEMRDESNILRRRFDEELDRFIDERD